MHSLFITKKTLAILIASTSLITNNSLAGTMGVDTKSPLVWVSSLSVGPAWQHAGKTQTFYLTPEIEKRYVANRAKNVLFDGELFLGLQKELTPTLKSQLGLAIGFTSNAKLYGVIWDDAAPEFDNYTYHYKVQNTHLVLKGKLLADINYWLIPWVSGSLGVSFNDAHGFQNTPTIFEALPNPNFSSHTLTTWTYKLGVGAQKTLNVHWQLGAGYEFADLGKSRLGRASGQTLNSGLSLNHLYTHGVLFNLTYIA
ncbi:MAG: porin family protein [Tatlockia sp.]|nr:porin family protein [Tatlockia sp.]